MSFKETYQQAIEKVSADEKWKQETLQKMHSAPSFFVWKKAALPMAAGFLILCSGVLLVSSQNGTLSTAQSSSSNIADANSETLPQTFAAPRTREMPDTSADSETSKALDSPQAAMFSTPKTTLPLIAFSEDSVSELSADQLPVSVELESAQVLPVWQTTEDGFLLMGEYPILSEQVVSEQVLCEQPETSFDQTSLVYVQSAGYVQPVYRFVPTADDLPNLYVLAIGGEYYK